jgi:hypothetical protein
MKIAEHLMRINRIERTMLDKLDREKDYELYVEACGLIGTGALNAILHAHGVTKETWDLLHSYKPPLEVPADLDLRQYFDDLKYIEDLRPGYLRGTKPWNPEEGKKCYENCQKIKKYAEKIVAEKGLKAA